jgi:hypothetical protein
MLNIYLASSYADKLLKPALPYFYPEAVATAAIAGDIQCYRAGIRPFPDRFPPARYAFRRKPAGAMAFADISKTDVFTGIIHSARHCFARFFQRKIVA